jgi:hypothetical protein
MAFMMTMLGTEFLPKSYPRSPAEIIIFLVFWVMGLRLSIMGFYRINVGIKVNWASRKLISWGLFGLFLIPLLNILVLVILHRKADKFLKIADQKNLPS